MAKTSKLKKKTVKSKVKTVNKAKDIKKTPSKISKNYVPKEVEKYMCEKHKVFFTIKINFLFI